MILTTLLFSCILVASHTIADFFAQTDTQATNKSSSMVALASHIVTYGVVMFILMSFCLFLFFDATESSLLRTFVYWILFNMAAHAVTDYVSSRLSKRAYERGDRHAFFCIIGVDQFVHIVTLLLSSYPIIEYITGV